MPNWDNKTCGNCGFVAENEDALPVRTCGGKCGLDKCPRCHGGNENTPMCQDCASDQKAGRGAVAFTQQFPNPQGE